MVKYAMAEKTVRRVKGKLTEAQKRRHRAIREQVGRDKPRLARKALTKKAERIALRDAMLSLKTQREARGLSLGDVADRSGIDKSRLSKLENDPDANPTLTTLTRIADAIGVKLTIQVNAA